MCMMIAPANVQSTRIFATLSAGKQVLVYEAAITTASVNAMVLPIPIRSPSTPIALLDLSAHSRFFTSLYVNFVDTRPPPPPAFGAPPGASPPRVLEVVTIGSFEASIVPALDDFSRLDARFHLPPGLRAVLATRYADWAFVVYQLAPGNILLHPFGVTFESRWTKHLFFPTVHVHDGQSAPPGAFFAHSFFAQGAKLHYQMRPRPQILPLDPLLAEHALPDFVNLVRPLDCGSQFGEHPNVDMFAALDA